MTSEIQTAVECLEKYLPSMPLSNALKGHVQTLLIAYADACRERDFLRDGLVKAEIERDRWRNDCEMGNGCLIMIAELLTRLGCEHGPETHKATPPMFYPEWIACVFKKNHADLLAERDRLRASEAIVEETLVQTFANAIAGLADAALIKQTQYDFTHVAAAVAQLGEYAKSLEAERDRLYTAIRDSGYGILQTSAGWSIHDVSERGKEEERRTAEVIAENIGLQAERDRLRFACYLIVAGWGHQDGVSRAVAAARAALGEK